MLISSRSLAETMALIPIGGNPFPVGARISTWTQSVALCLLKYLQMLLDKGLSVSTIEVYCMLLPSWLVFLVDNRTVGFHPPVSCFLKRALQLQPAYCTGVFFGFATCPRIFLFPLFECLKQAALMTVW